MLLININLSLMCNMVVNILEAISTLIYFLSSICFCIPHYLYLYISLIQTYGAFFLFYNNCQINLDNLFSTICLTLDLQNPSNLFLIFLLTLTLFYLVHAQKLFSSNLLYKPKTLYFLQL